MPYAKRKVFFNSFSVLNEDGTMTHRNRRNIAEKEKIEFKYESGCFNPSKDLSGIMTSHNEKACKAPFKPSHETFIYRTVRGYTNSVDFIDAVEQ
ncbi:MAG: hypothetical protein ACM3UK_00065 [Actinomycetes bacterium]